jgi:hypothetical protein
VRTGRRLTVIVLLTFAAAPALAQSPATGSRYLPLDHWAYEYVERLESRGLLPGLNPLVQPYRRLDVAWELARLTPDSLRAPMAGWVRMLKDEFSRELATVAGEKDVRWGLETMAGAHGSTSRRLDAARPLGSGDLWPWYRGGGWVETGPLAAETRVYGDTHFRDDPDAPDPGYDPRAQRGGRTDNAYLSVALPFGAIEAGSFTRNWGPIGSPSLMVSGVPTVYPQVGFEARAGRFTLRSFAAELDTVGGQKRQFFAHRIDYHTKDLTLSFGESNLYVYPSLLLRFLNPVDFLFVDGPQVGEPGQNLMLDAQFWLRRSGWVLYGDGLLDDIDVTPETPKPEPPQYAFTLGARLTALPPWVELRTEYQQVGAWTYRTPNYVDRYSYFNRGLGANYSDYDRLTLWADLYPPVRGLRLSPAALLQRQWEGNFRDSIPGGYYWGRPALAYGVGETTLRLALRGRYQPLRQAWLAWDVGPNFVRNKDHVIGARKTEFEGTAEIGVRLDFPRRPR